MSETEAKTPTLADALAEAARLDPERFRYVAGGWYECRLRDTWRMVCPHAHCDEHKPVQQEQLAWLQADALAAIDKRDWHVELWNQEWNQPWHVADMARRRWAAEITHRSAVHVADTPALALLLAFNEALAAHASATFDPTVRFPDLEAQVPAAEEALKAEQGSGETFCPADRVADVGQWRSVAWADDVAALAKQVTALSLLANGLSGRLDREWSQLQRISRDLGKRVEALTLQVEHWGISHCALEARMILVEGHLTPNVPPGVTWSLRPIVTGFTTAPPTCPLCGGVPMFLPSGVFCACGWNTRGPVPDPPARKRWWCRVAPGSFNSYFDASHPPVARCSKCLKVPRASGAVFECDCPAEEPKPTGKRRWAWYPEGGWRSIVFERIAWGRDSENKCPDCCAVLPQATEYGTETECYCDMPLMPCAATEGPKGKRQWHSAPENGFIFNSILLKKGQPCPDCGKAPYGNPTTHHFECNCPATPLRVSEEPTTNHAADNATAE